MLKSKGPKSLKTSKAPGNDGFTPIYYKKFAGTLAPKLSKLLNYILQGHKLPEEMLHDNMILISKPNKDQSVPQNYRLILVLNNDLKNLGRLLADRLVSIISSLVAPEQTGFIPSRQITDNIRLASNIIQDADLFSRIVLVLVLLLTLLINTVWVLCLTDRAELTLSLNFH